MRESILKRNSLVSVLFYQTLNKVFNIIRHMISKFWFTILDFVLNSFSLRVFEWRFSSAHFECQNSKTPDINRFIIFCLLDYFWSQIFQSSTKSLSTSLGSMNRPTKISQFYPIKTQQNIFRLNISMYNILRV